jgi:hypothetical protein
MDLLYLGIIAAAFASALAHLALCDRLQGGNR